MGGRLLADMSGKEFRWERQKLGISRATMAADMGVSERSIEYWEWEVRPLPRYAENLLQCLKLARLVKERGLKPPK